MKAHKILKYMSVTTILLSLALLSLVLFWLLYPYRTIEFETKYQTMNNSYYQGDETAYKIKYCKYSDIEPTVTKKFIDGIEFTAEANKATLTRGCRTELVELKIPETLPAGRYRLVVFLDYGVNPLRTIKIRHESNWFTVKEIK